ncbi:hypothetical protein [[Clostridium] innocuum]|uniref:hypothetical protein n=1 Tax=Clostridium innocuum TaxID=1522 RepID=UPI000D6C521D|nr:hypothetical protein [[Clostridium] innocuum]PWJ09632.1 hypothetical protein ATF84_1317 [[Clostridium] innocuum]PWJ10140.1 hypothetical protein ATF84_1232 [[Clostridium] innocuum]SSA48947.1 hypothetical protein SAMN04487929_1232 [[Clostridium] innocuum]SSA49624.1 hypothetical protein SAMN04487929_1317 [[Clostridium] innocuum]
MNKDNDSQSTNDIFKNKKEIEKSCLNAAIDKIPYLQKLKLVENESQESPDFILKGDNTSIGIEHFHIDMLYLNKKKHTGLARYTYNDMRALYKRYHDKALDNSFDSQNAKDACKEIEDILNELIDCQNMFDYSFFIKEWERIFNDHYKKRFKYIKNNGLDKLGFLIEIRRYLDYPYIYKNTSVNSKSIPITKDLAESLNKLGDGVDFFIIVVKGLFDDYIRVEFYDIDNPALVQCDNFSFKKIFKKIQIKVE